MSSVRGKSLAELAATIHECRLCQRLVEWREAS
ncbi:MAG: hypothetical protein QOF13_2263, partial [Solirubrobacterales bacterium]|nr:hypothetical protein [Solirubrobacterales bacterium]